MRVAAACRAARARCRCHRRAPAPPPRALLNPSRAHALSRPSAKTCAVLRGGILHHGCAANEESRARAYTCAHPHGGANGGQNVQTKNRTRRTPAKTRSSAHRSRGNPGRRSSSSAASCSASWASPCSVGSSIVSSCRDRARSRLELTRIDRWRARGDGVDLAHADLSNLEALIARAFAERAPVRVHVRFDVARAADLAAAISSALLQLRAARRAGRASSAMSTNRRWSSGMLSTEDWWAVWLGLGSVRGKPAVDPRRGSRRLDGADAVVGVDRRNVRVCLGQAHRCRPARVRRLASRSRRGWSLMRSSRRCSRSARLSARQRQRFVVGFTVMFTITWLCWIARQRAASDARSTRPSTAATDIEKPA